MFRTLSSVKLAVVVILLLTFSLALATTLESNYDTPTAQYWVYRSWWFKGVLGLLGVNILAVMVDRWPWKPRHTPFLLAHIGILAMLFGSWMTEKFGLDASMRVSEGETTSVVDIDENFLTIYDKSDSHRVPVPWIPPGATFHPIHLDSDNLTVDQYISRSEPVYDFAPNSLNPTPDKPSPGSNAHPAVQIEIKGGVMRIQQAVWLWTGHANWNDIHMGPAQFRFGAPGVPDSGKPVITFAVDKDGDLTYVAQTTEGKKSEGKFPPGKALGQVIDPGWHGGVTIKILKYLPDAVPLATYKPSRVQYGKEAPPSAVHLVVGKGDATNDAEGSSVWLGMGEHAVLYNGGHELDVSYANRRLVLPFGIKLNRFKVDRYQGTNDPASYRSDVSVVSKDKPFDETISMNEPLHHDGITLYQASYEDAQPRPTVSIFSVNRDPGRIWKYTGSLLIVLGSICLFAVKYRHKQPVPAYKE